MPRPAALRQRSIPAPGTRRGPLLGAIGYTDDVETIERMGQ
ncbi:hypothetical protein OO015_04820 [Thermomicrobium sp. 4228-Ro]|nr:hypothetical protein [Thermomicrobium sp. 4228-Ro]MCX2726816.1 hypothetical protein [Thermomicrobium sp. 4228-Ro]